jgi:hypothetical protein
MANHELPEWEAPSTPSTAHNSFWKKLSQPFISKNPSLATPQPTLDHKNTSFGSKSPLTPTQNFDKETDVPEPAAETATTVEEISPQGNKRRSCIRSRRGILLIVLAVVLLLALIIGLSVSLSHKAYVNLNTFIYNNPI